MKKVLQKVDQPVQFQLKCLLDQETLLFYLLLIPMLAPWTPTRLLGTVNLAHAENLQQLRVRLVYFE